MSNGWAVAMVWRYSWDWANHPVWKRLGLYWQSLEGLWAQLKNPLVRSKTVVYPPHKTVETIFRKQVFHISSGAEDWKWWWCTRCRKSKHNHAASSNIGNTCISNSTVVLELKMSHLKDFFDAKWDIFINFQTLWCIYFVNYSYCHFQTFMLQMGKVLKSKVLKLPQCVVYHQVTYYVLSS